MNLQKTPKIVSKAMRNSAKGKPCTLRLDGCDGGGETTVFAHLNSEWKGMGNKSPDIFGVYACYKCHLKLDAGKVSYKDQLRALQETQLQLVEQQLIEVK